ncbi:hypothetical protein GOP47_0014235 [Adiantum capillus-veneris]|uniref:GDSL esterase/lipase n=1 Tax=Adiantum capillus-veneris TaxID=13818 RepID=A0A9D4ZDB3_ADICA|nr:hypothetical protein GOP47_0014235 [Adiantum capillus-veneris]
MALSFTPSYVQGSGKNAKTLFVFGDSYADTGNHDPLDPAVKTSWSKPYGLTWPGHPSGRFSDGRVLTDFFAAHMGTETPITYRVVQKQLKRHGSTGRVKAACAWGINFAYGGSGVFPTFGSQFVTISGQINQLRASLSEGLVSISNSSTALLVVAGNDYTAYGLLHPKKEAGNIFIAKVVSGIVAALEVLHGLGFRRLAVSNLEPFGCFPAVTYLSNYTKCNKTENEESGFHNKLLASQISKLKANLPDTDISVLDLERAFSLSLGGIFKHSRSQWKSCCKAKQNGGCGLVNAKGKPWYSVCSKPNKAFYWDTVHPTDSGWESVSKILFF